MIPNVDTAKSMLGVFLSKEFARNFIYKAIHEKYGGSLCKLLSNSKIIKYISLYMYNRILDKLAGSKVSLVLSPPNYSLAVASIVAQRFGVTVLLIPNYLYRSVKSNLTDLKGLPVHHGSIAVAIFMTFNKDDLIIIKEFISKLRLNLKLIEAIVLADIIDSVEGMEKYMGCVLGFDKCSDKNPCVMHSTWIHVREKFTETFQNKTLADFNYNEIHKY